MERLETRRLLALNVPALNSLPSATRQLFLDFDGNIPFIWNDGTSHGPYAVYGPAGSGSNVPGFDSDGDPNNFSAQELSDINQIWQTVSEKYSPFQINVTTVDPGNRTDGITEQVILGGSRHDWLKDGKVAGISAQSGFSNSLSNVCFVFSADIAASRANRVRFLAEAAAHEAGHSFGLLHQRAPGDEYYDGDTVRAPIMGDSPNCTNGAKGIWWYTNNWPGQNSGDTVRDEVATLASMIGFRADDFGAFTLTRDAYGNFTPVNGFIGLTSDIDAFSFTSATNTVSFQINNAALGGMLTPRVNIFDPNTGFYVNATEDFSNPNRATITTDQLVAGRTYRLNVFGTGQYGDIGQYTLTGNVPQFATYNASTKTVFVTGLPGNNNVVVSVEYNGTNSPGLLTITNSLNGGGPGSQTYAMSAVDTIQFSLPSGDDTVAIRPLKPLQGNPGNGPQVYFNAGGGTNHITLEKYNRDTGDFEVAAGGVGPKITMGTTSVSFFDTPDTVTLRGTLTDNYFFIKNWTADSTLTCMGVGGYGDHFFVYPAVLNSIGGPIILDGADGNDVLNYDAIGLPSRSINLFSTQINCKVNLVEGYAQRDIDHASIETIDVFGTAEGDGMSVYSLFAGTTVNFHGGNGDDHLTVGDSIDNLDASYIPGNLYFYGDAGTDSADLDDAAAATARDYILDHTHIGATVGGNIFNAGGVEALTITGGDSVANRFYAYEGQVGVLLTLIGGSANDAFNMLAGTYWDATIDGKGGTDTLLVDDRGGAFAPYRTDLSSVSLTHYYGLPYVINYSNIENPTYYGAPSTTLLNVFSTPGLPSIYQWTMFMNSGNDTINVYPHNGFNGVTNLFGALGISGGGGTDTINFDDSGNPFPLNLIFNNPYGPSTCDISGFGVGLVGVGSDVETININGGAEDDTFRIDSFQSGNALTINGNGGGDTCDIATLSGDVATNITSINGLTFNGGAGSDLMRFANHFASSAFTYNQYSNSFQVFKSAGGWSMIMPTTSVEILYASGGMLVDTITVNSMPAGQTLQLGTGAALDNVTLNAGPVEFIYPEDFATLNIAAGVSVKVPVSHVGLFVRGTLTNNGKLDLYRSDLAVDYTPGNSPIGSLVGSTYTGIQGMVQRGRNTGGWNGATGILSTGLSAMTSIGVAEASKVFGLSGTQTRTFNNQPIDASTVVVKYTYAGDANLDGKINIDDYVLGIDQGISTGLKGWSNGDFNYDGKINVDDYIIIDQTIRTQGAPITSAAGVESIAPTAAAALVSQPSLVWTATNKPKNDPAELLA